MTSAGAIRSRICLVPIEPGKRSGQPCVRGLRITVWDVLTWLAGATTEQQILDDYPELFAAGPDSSALDTTAPSVFAALQERLGLKLEPGTALLDSVVIDQAEKPSQT
ncbi:MAG TPA: DUF433 domain-containing protein [Candidatus Acidoferrales bacterium]|jgi:hypothetical protein|nr:DUF433 domain-containing protein [Candidatus Acidoferrales bacterium]